MLGELGARLGLPVDVAEVGAACRAAVEDEEDVAGRREERLADRIPADGRDRAVALTILGKCVNNLHSRGKGDITKEVRTISS